MNDFPERASNHRRPSAVLVALIIIIAALIPRLLTYERYLPVVDYSDEVTYVALAHELRGMSDQTGLRELYGAVAPLYVRFNELVQRIQYPLRPHSWEMPADYFYTLRLFAVGFGVMTALCIAWAGWILAGRSGALLAGLVWALSPVVLQFNTLAIPDPPLYWMCALALAAGLQAIRSHSIRWLAVSMLAGIAAIYIKLWIASAMFPFLMTSFYLLRQDRKRMLRPLLILFGIGMLFGLYFLLVINPFANTNKMDTAFSDGLLNNLVNPLRLINNLWHTLYAIDGGLNLAYGVLIAGILAWFYARRRGIQRLPGWPLLLVVVYTLTTLILSAGVSMVDAGSAGRMRHVFPVVTGAIVLWAACLVQSYRVFQTFFKARPRQRWALALPLVILLLMLPGVVSGNIRTIQTLHQTHINTQALNWFDSSPPRDGVVLLLEEYPFDRLWNRLWGAYTGSKPYEWWWIKGDDLSESTPSNWLDRNIRWLVVSEESVRNASDPVAFQAYLDQLLLVKHIHHTGSNTDIEGEVDNFFAYRFEQPDYDAGFDYAGIFRLKAYDLTSTSPRPGDTLSFRPYWQLQQASTQNHSMFLHLYRQDDVEAGAPVILSQVDSEPLHNGNRPTSTWDDLSEVYLAEPLQFGIPADLAPGAYVLAIGLYDYQTGERLLNADGSSYYAIPLIVTAES